MFSIANKCLSAIENVVLAVRNAFLYEYRTWRKLNLGNFGFHSFEKLLFLVPVVFLNVFNPLFVIARNKLSCVVRKPVFGLPTRSDTNRAVQAQKMARGWKFRI